MDRQRGASLVIALVMILVLGVVLTAVLSYANTTVRVTRTYQKQRVERYAGDGAIEAAINYVRGQALMGRDPDYAASDPPCVYDVPTDAGLVTVSCAADPGSGSGIPEETGLVPDDAILATGARHQEVGPLNQTQCDTFWGIGQNAVVENSIYFNQGEVRGYFEEASLIPCAERNRTLGTFAVRGDIVAAGRVAGEGSIALQPKLVNGVSTPSTLKARYGCAIAVNPGGCGTPSASEYTDPGNGGTTTAWQHVPIDWTTRTTGYRWNGSALVGAATCGVRDTIIFLPGNYPNANTINRYTANPACRESTFWFAPDAGDDGVLMTDDDKTGAYYFGFTNGNTDWSCSDLSNLPHRLCIGGGSANSSPRAVVGTPDGWNPLAVPGSGPTPRTVTMSTAQTIDEALSQSWRDPSNARTIDGSVAYYEPTACLFGICISSDRAIRLRDFTPEVAQGPDADKNKIYVEVSHRQTGTTDDPRVQIRTVSNESGTRTCPDTYELPKNVSGTLRTDKLRLVGGTEEAAATSVAQCLDGADRINGVQLTFTWTGNVFNSGSPRIYLDGARLSFQSTPGAAFPLPTAESPAAQLDCDATKAGGQFIFGGDSHAYVPDGSLEICAGPYPTSPGDHMQIGVYGIPAVPPLLGSGTPTVGGYQNTSSTSISNANGARDIAEPGGRSLATINFSSNQNCSGFCAWTRQYTAQVNVPMQAYPQANYPGLTLDSLTARVTYNSRNTDALEFIETNDRTACRAWVIAKLALSFGFAEGTNCANSQLQVGNCTRDAPMTSDLRSWDVDVTGCVGQGSLAGGINVQWRPKADHLRFCAFWICSDFGSRSDSHQLDGVELLVGLRQTSGSTSPVPQSGCIVDYPNYWEGVGRNDCAIIKADSLRPTNGIIPDWIVAEGSDWIGRLSIQGTVYAPSAAFEIDELDSAYALASRGLVVRHLRVKGFRNRPGYNAPVVDNQLDDTPANREATFVACRRNEDNAGSDEPCGFFDDDSTLTRARVRFAYDANTPDDWTPEVVWWTDAR
ncbi:MAG: hypothetical protein KDA98_08885 [Acidimicrobiales bacterium]|nr:hypothetical protein [Acidimicrobiales bacterium]